MKVSKPLVLYLGIILISIAIIGYTLRYFYGKLGGFDEIEVVTLEPLTRTIAGINYRGKAQTAKYEKIVNMCADQIINEKLDGTLSIVTFKNDTLDTNEVDLFIGIDLNASMSEVPYDFEIREFNTNSRYAVFLTMHPAVRPSIDKVENLIMEQAKMDGNELEPLFLELYYTDDSMTVEAWTK